MNKDIRLKAFSAISDFLSDLENLTSSNSGNRERDSIFSQNHNIRLYNRLIEMTTFRDTGAIERHILAFREMFNNSPKWDGLVKYSPKVFIDLKPVWKLKSDDDKKAIYNHLKVIYTLVYKGTPQESEAMERLKTTANLVVTPQVPSIPKNSEGDFIKQTLDKITAQMSGANASQNPMEMVTGLMQSGFFNEFVGDLQSKFTSGEINISSLINTVTSVISEVTPEGPEGDQIKGMMNMALGSMPEIPKQESLKVEEVSTSNASTNPTSVTSTNSEEVKAIELPD